jgi:hypothetical protein
MAESVATAYGITADLIRAFPELQKVYDLYKAGDTTQAELEYYKTNYYRNLTTTSKNRAQQKASQPGVYNQGLETFKLEQRRRLITKGINLDEATFNSIMQSAYDKGLDDNQIDLQALSKFKGTIGGETLGRVQSLEEYAKSFGMSYSPTTLNSWSQGIVSGTNTIFDIQEKIRRDSASAYPVFADDINKGTSVDALASAYKNSMATILEIDADTISYNDPTFRRALQYVGPDGKPAVKPIWQFEAELRQDPRWDLTDNARATVDSLSLKVLRDFGVA